MEKFRWCFIGTGKIAHKVAKEILSSINHEIVSCYSRNQIASKKFALEFNAKRYEDPLKAINDERVDGVYIATTHNVHFKFAKMALESHKPVLVEKPLTVNLQECEQLIALSKKNNTYLAEAMWSLYGLTPYAIKDRLDSLEIGQLKKAYFTYHLNSKNYAPRVANPIQAGGALLDITIYPIAFSYFLFGYPKEIKATGTIKNTIDEKEEIVFTYDNDFKVYISASIVDYKGLEKMKIIGNKGYIFNFFYHCSNKFLVSKGLFNKQIIKINNQQISYLNEFNIVSNEIRSSLKESKMMPLTYTLEIMKIIEEIKKQIGLDYLHLED